MDHDASRTAEVIDHDLVDEAPTPGAPDEAPAKERSPGALRFKVPVGTHRRPAKSAQEPVSDPVERAFKDDAAFLEAVQLNLPSFGLKAGGKAIDFRALKYWDADLRSHDEERSKHDAGKNELWKRMRTTYGPFFDATDADDNDYVVIVEYPTGEQAAIHVRRVESD